MYYAETIARLIDELNRLPGVGPKTAQRLAFHLLRRPTEEVRRLAEAMVKAREGVRRCSQCCNLTDIDPCRTCRDERRDRAIICVLEGPAEVVALEKTREFKGLYHVLHGALSPVDGVGPDDLTIKQLLARVGAGGVREVVVATNPDVKGEATALYLARLLKPLGVVTTRLARGLPVGADLEYADEITLARALEFRREI